MFDLVCGTSTGGIIGLALALRKLSSEKVKEVYKIRGPRLFKQHSTFKLFTEGFAFDRTVLEDEVRAIVTADTIQNHFNESPKVTNFVCSLFRFIRISCNIQVFVTTVNKRTAELCLIKNYETPMKSLTHQSINEATLIEAALATSAAPLYFPASTIGACSPPYYSDLGADADPFNQYSGI